MNKKFIKSFIIIFLILIAGIGGIRYYFLHWYKDAACKKVEGVTLEQVEKISVYSLLLEKKELSETDALKVIELCNRLDARGLGTTDYKNYVGGLTHFMFYIEFQDGTVADIASAGQFFVINGLGYFSYKRVYDADKHAFLKDTGFSREVFDLFVELSEKYFDNDIWP